MHSSFPLRYQQCALPRLSVAGHYTMRYREFWRSETEYCPTHLPVLICVHGLARVAADFDSVAEVLTHTHRVICPDIVGRGDSDWIPSYATGSYYQIPHYIADILALLAHLNLKQVDWLGTSMGGLIGIGIAATLQSPIRRLILNDVGIRIPQAALARIASYVEKQPPYWESQEEALRFYQETYTSFGIQDHPDWVKFTNDSIRPRGHRWVPHYDPRIVVPLQKQAKFDINLKLFFDAIHCPTLVLRGEHSDVLLLEDYHNMLKRPNIEGLSISGCAHAPALLDTKSISTIAAFLTS